MTIRNTILALTAAALLGACTAHGEKRPFGQAYTEQFHAQIVNEPYAAPTPVTGMDGKLARRGMDKRNDPEADKGPSFAEVLESMMDN